jgi:hypothetical protein
MAAPTFPVTSFVLGLADPDAGERFRRSTDDEKRRALRAAGVDERHHDAFLRGRHEEINGLIQGELRERGVHVSIERPAGTIIPHP